MATTPLNDMNRTPGVEMLLKLAATPRGKEYAERFDYHTATMLMLAEWLSGGISLADEILEPRKGSDDESP